MVKPIYITAVDDVHQGLTFIVIVMEQFSYSPSPTDIPRLDCHVVVDLDWFDIEADCGDWVNCFIEFVPVQHSCLSGTIQTWHKDLEMFRWEKFEVDTAPEAAHFVFLSRIFLQKFLYFNQIPLFLNYIKTYS